MKNVQLIIQKGSPGQPRYKQIVASVICSLEQKKLKAGDQLPSSNQLAEIFRVSRDTVIKAVNELKSLGYIKSQPGKGYFLAVPEIKRIRNVFVLFDSFNSFKEELYNSLIDNLGPKVKTDIFFHHQNNEVFKRLIEDHSGLYTDYVIMPTTESDSLQVLQNLKNYGNVILLDQGLKEFGYKFPAVFQDFTSGIFDALNDIASFVFKYKKIYLVIKVHPIVSSQNICNHIIEGFDNFCIENGILSDRLSGIRENNIEAGNCYFVHEDKDLEQLILLSREHNLEIGKDIGIISFNETPLKKVVANGITTISVDFGQYGCELANMILNNKNEVKINPTRVKFRESL
jgi:DNA-binding transcriptional regulator YhcF (GntR family)